MQDTDIIRTAFDRSERDMGCEFMDWEGWYWPNHFGDALAEHLASETTWASGTPRRFASGGSRDATPLPPQIAVSHTTCWA